MSLRTQSFELDWDFFCNPWNSRDASSEHLDKDNHGAQWLSGRMIVSRQYSNRPNSSTSSRAFYHRPLRSLIILYTCGKPLMTACRNWFVLFDLIPYVRVNNLSVTSGRVFLGWTSTKLGLMCLAQGIAEWCPESCNLQFSWYHSYFSPDFKMMDLLLLLQQSKSTNRAFVLYKTTSLAKFVHFRFF